MHTQTFPYIHLTYTHTYIYIYTHTDFFNPHEPRMKKAAGTTPEERDSFTDLLAGAQMVDTFRQFHPEVEGVYSYFSMRAGNRPFNRGMRLDYVLASRNMVSVGGTGEGEGKTEEGKRGVMPLVLDSFILDEEEEYMKMSDHAPVGCLLGLGLGAEHSEEEQEDRGE